MAEDKQSEFERQLALLKKKHERIYIATINDETFVFRALNRKEYEEIHLWEQDESIIEEKVCSLAVLFPIRVNWSESKAGVAPLLHQQIIEKSGFMDRHQLRMYLDAGRYQMASFHEQAMCLIVTAFPQYKLEEVEEWPVEKLMKFLARAEWTHHEIHGRKWIELRENEEQTPEEPVTIQQVADGMREEGLDPMIEFGPPEKPPFVDYPLIGGLKVWENEGVLSLVREQLQRISGQ